MAFKQGAIGFYLQLEDQLTPELKTAGTSYDKFVNRLEKANTRAFSSAKKGMGALAGLAGGFTDLPRQASRSYDQAMAKIAKRSRPVKVPVEFVMKGKGASAFSEALGSALSKAFKQTKIRLSASMPKKRNPLFDGDQGLRTQFKGIVQPPDMSGSLVPRFNKGGVVTAGSGRKGVDDVLALLGKGEIVLPADVSKNLIQAAGAARGLNNQFIAFPPEIAESVSAIESLLKAGKKLKASFDAGLDPAAAVKLRIILDQTALEQAKLSSGAQTLSVNYRTKLAPAILAVAADLELFRSEVAPTQNAMANFVKSIVGNTGFLAIHAAMKTVQEDFLEIRGAMTEVAEGSGLNAAAEGLVTNFLNLNKVLHLSSDELSSLRGTFLDMNEALPMSLRNTSELSKSLNDLVHANAGKELALGLYRGLTLFEAATGVAAESTQTLALVLTKQLNLGADQTIDLFSTLAKKGAAVGVSASTVTDNLAAAAEAGKLAFAAMSPAKAQGALSAITQIATAVDAVGGPGKEFAETLAGALQNPDKLFSMASALGTTQDELHNMLETGDMTGFFKKMETAGPMASQALAASFNVSEDAIIAMSTQTSKMNSSLLKMRGASTAAGAGLKDLSAMASANMTTFQKLKGAVGGFLTQFGFVTDSIQFLRDLDPTAILSGAFLITKMWPSALGSVGKSLLGLGTRVLAISGLTALWSGAMGFAAVAAQALGVALAVGFWPLTAIVAGLALVVAGVYYFRKEIAAAATGFMDGFLDPILEGMRPLIEAVKEFGTMIGDMLAPIFGSTFESAQSDLSGISDTFKWIGEYVGATLGLSLRVAFAPIWAVFKIVTLIGDAFAYIMDLIGQMSQSSWFGLLTDAAALVGGIVGGPGATVAATAAKAAMSPTTTITPASITTSALSLPTKASIDTMSSQRAVNSENRDDELLAVLKSQLTIMQRPESSNSGISTSAAPRRASGIVYDVAQGG